MKPSKYRNKWTEYNGVKYHSGREARFAAELDLLVKADEIRSWRRQIPIPLRVSGQLICKYIIDFEITHNTGELEYVEVKGYAEPLWKLKFALFQALYPGYKTRVVK